MDAPIGLFDSGFGGLTVLKELVRELPNEDFIYLGDTANVPYEDKSSETITRIAIENASILLEKGIKLLIVPCHTVCCHAFESLKKISPVPVLGVVEPLLLKARHFQRIAVLGTSSTVASGVYQNRISKMNPEAKVFAKACPFFVPLIEKGFHEHPLVQLAAQNYLSEIKGKVDAALLACTHYPLIQKVLGDQLGSDVRLIEPAIDCARNAKQILIEMSLLKISQERSRCQFFVTQEPDKFQKIGKLFFGNELEKVEKK